MNCLLVKVKTGTRVPTYRKMLSGEEIYTLPENLGSAVDYDPATLLCEEEFYKIQYFSQTPYYLDILGSDFSSVNYDNLRKDEFSKIDFLCSFQDDILFSEHK